jgi:outer membrane murein-binding lipoprotein Lpp
MGAGQSVESSDISILNETVTKTVTKNIQNHIERTLNEQGQTSQNVNSTIIRGITCSGNINIGSIEQSISQVQDLGAIEKATSESDFKQMISQAAQAAQKAALDNVESPNFEPFFGNKSSQEKRDIVNRIANEVTNETNIKSLREIFTKQIQEAQNVNKAMIEDIVCGGNFTFEGAKQNIQAMQVASKLGEAITKIATETKVDTTTTQDASGELKQKKGISTVVDSVGDAGSKIIDSIGGVIGKVGGIYAVIIVVVVIAIVGIIIVFILNIGKIGSAVSGVVETAGKTGLVPTGKMGRMRVKIPKIPAKI